MKMRCSIVFLLTLIPLYTSASFFETLIHGRVAPKVKSREFHQWIFFDTQASIHFQQQQRINNFIYDECGITKTCFGIPDNCITTQSCEAIATTVVVGNNYNFELQSYDGISSRIFFPQFLKFDLVLCLENIAYVALGLSRDNRMGEDSVMECVNEEGTAKAYTSYNNRRDNTREGVVRSQFVFYGLRPWNLQNFMSSVYEHIGHLKVIMSVIPISCRL